MHPILRSGSGLSLYLAIWIFFGCLFVLVLSVSAHLEWQTSVAVTVPIVIILALGCLGPWYSSRALPLRSTPLWKVVGTHLLVGMCTSAIALAPARLLGVLAQKT